MKSNGEVRYDSKQRVWQVQCAPHVALRFKRVFGCVDRRSTGKFSISDTPANAHDLRWFLTRYPMMVHAVDRLEARTKEHKERISLVEELLARKHEPPQFDLAIPARPYQREAAQLILASGNLLLADDVGLGKTAASICTLTDKRTLPALVVTLTHLPIQWQNEIAKFAPTLRTHIIRSSQPYDVSRAGRRNRAQVRFDDVMPDVLIINYHKLRHWAETLAKLVKSVIFDECQELRRRGDDKHPSLKFYAARHICEHTDFRWGLSATPFYNFGGEMFNVMDCIAPGSLGTLDEFATEWCGGSSDEKAPIKDPVAFGTYLREEGLMLRRTRKDVGRELPPVQIIQHFVECNTEALDQVQGKCVEMAKLILSQGTEDYRGQKMQASEEFSNKLRQATGIAKSPYVAEFVKLLIESGERVVLYGWHRAVYDIWLEKLKEFRPLLYTGTESAAAKEQAKQKFLAGEHPLMILSLRSGAGLDGLQKVCRIVVFGELDWSPGVHAQCIGRVHRDGQEESVSAYFLEAEEGSDPFVSQVLGLKQMQIESVRGDEVDLIEKLETGGKQVKGLAAAYLQKHGISAGATA